MLTASDIIPMFSLTGLIKESEAVQNLLTANTVFGYKILQTLTRVWLACLPIWVSWVWDMAWKHTEKYRRAPYLVYNQKGNFSLRKANYQILVHHNRHWRHSLGSMVEDSFKRTLDVRLTRELWESEVALTIDISKAPRECNSSNSSQ